MDDRTYHMTKYFNSMNIEELTETIDYLQTLLIDVKHRKQFEMLEIAEKNLLNKWYSNAKTLIKSLNDNNVYDGLKESYNNLCPMEKWINIGKFENHEFECDSDCCPSRFDIDNQKLERYYYVLNSCFKCCETCFNNGQGWLFESIEKKSKIDLGFYYGRFTEWLKNDNDSFKS